MEWLKQQSFWRAYFIILGVSFLILTSTALIRVTALLKDQSANGRYELHIHPEFGRYQYLLDTRTGKVWQSVTFTDLNNQPTAWLYMWKLDDPGKEAQFYKLFAKTK